MYCDDIVLSLEHKWFGPFLSLVNYHKTFLCGELEQYIVQIENQPSNNLYDFLVDAVEHLNTFAIIQMVLIVFVV
jgi:hypothetical protein